MGLFTTASSSTVGTITFGTAYTLNPYAVSTASGAVAHGLGQIPDGYKVELTCQTAEKNYAIGQKIQYNYFDNNAANTGFDIAADATNFYVSTGNTLIDLVDRNAPGAGAAITAANWSLTVTPWKKN
jgi:hypothetical protein